MNKIFKKALCSFLVVVMCLTMAPLQGFTELELPDWNLPDFEIGKLFSTTAKAATEGYYTYTVENSEATITDVDETISGDITIPSTLGGYPVTSIGDYAFQSCDNIASITIPNSVTTIGEAAFNWCDNLVAINIPDAVTSIGADAFSFCISLDSITIPDSVTSIGDHAFIQCESLASITIPNSVTSIGNCAFGWCTSLESITIPNSVTSIGESAFIQCESLASITIPNSVTSIGDYAFAQCFSLENITLPDSVTTIGARVFSCCTNLKSITLPNTITSIEPGMFDYCTSLENITIPDTVTNISADAFIYCTSLESVTIPGSVTLIDADAFYNTAYYNNADNWSDGVLYIDNYLIATKSNEISSAYTIKDGTKLISTAAFSGCDNLDSITIPDSVTIINRDAFYNSAYYNNPENWNNNVLYIGNCLIDTNEEEISGAYTIKDGTRLIADWAFDFSENLESITIPDSLTTIGYCAFYYCTSLASITIPDSVTTIEVGAFAYTNLNSITIPRSVTSIGYGVFSGCNNLEAITVDENNNYYCNDAYGVLFNKDKTELVQYPAGNQMTSYSIPDSVSNIERGAFEYCNNLVSITIPDSVTSIEAFAFADCSNLTDVYFIGTETEWNSITIYKENQPLTQANIHFICTHSSTEELPGKEETCTEPGYTVGTQCIMCGKILVSQTEIPAKGHTYKPVVTPPTCTAQGYTTYTCACGDAYTADEVAALEHEMGEWTVTKPATCEEKGEEERRCIYCDYPETREIAMTEHTDSDSDGHCDNCDTDELNSNASCLNWFLKLIEKIKQFFKDIIAFFRSIGDFT